MENINAAIQANNETETSIISEVETTGEQESSISEIEGGNEQESSITEMEGGNELESSITEMEGGNEQESVISETGNDDNEGKARETTWVEDLQVENDATVAGTLKAHNIVTDMTDAPEKDGHGFYSSGAAYQYTPTHIDIDDSKQAEDGTVALSLRNADNKLLGIVATLYTGISEKDRKEIEDGSSTGISQLKAWVNNALSKLQWQYISKEHDDTSDYNISVGGMAVNGNASVKGNASVNHDLDVLGTAILNTVRSADYNNAAETGFSIEKDSNGRYQAFLTNLTVWGKAVFNELEIRKLSYTGGDIYLSGAGSKIIKAVPVKKVTKTSTADDGTETTTVAWEACDVTDDDCVGWKCYLLADDGTTATMNYWQEGDQARCRTMGEITSSASYENVSNRSFWRTIPDDGVSAANEKIYGTKTEIYTDADGNEQTRETVVELYDGQMFAWIVIGKHSLAFDGIAEGDPNTADLQDAPQAGDTIVLDGNRHRGSDGAYDKKDRQNVITLETTGTYAPRIACYANITEYKHTVTKDGKEVSLSVFETSPSGGTKINSSRFEWTSDDGSTVNLINYRGDWSSSSTYHKNDQVNHDNAVWVCVANSGVDVIEEPTDTAVYWKKILTGGKGDKGEDAVTYTLEATPGYIRLDADGSIDRSNQYADDKYMLINGYKNVGAKRYHQWGTVETPISVALLINDGAAWYECTDAGYFDGGEGTHTEFEPSIDSYSSLISEIEKNGLRSAKAIMYEDKPDYSLDPDNVPSDKILATLDIPIVKDGKEGESGESYGVSLTIEKRTVSSVTEDCLVVTFTKSGAEGVTTTENVQVIGGYAQVYVDGTLDDSMTSRLNLNTSDAGELMKSAYPEAFTAGYITVKWYDKEGGTLLGMGSLTRGKDGEAAVSYGVQVSPYYYGSSKAPGLWFDFTKTTGATAEQYTNVTKIGCTVAIYADGKYYKDESGHINGGASYFLYSSYPDDPIDEASVVTVMMYHDGVLVASTNLANGKQGTGAFEIIADPETIVIDSDDNGLATDLSSASAALMCLRDGKEVSGVTFAKGACVNCAATVSAAGVVSITSVKTQTMNGVTVSSTSGSVTVNATDPTTKNTYTKTIPFAVNVSKLNGSMIADNKKFETVYNKLTNDGASTDLTWYESRIEQTARNISLKVQEKNVGRRNLLTGSAFRKQGEGWSEMSSGIGFITINGGYDGTNALRCPTNNGNRVGPRWNAPNVKLERGKTYTLSFYAKTNDVSVMLYTECLYATSATSGDDRPEGYTGPTGFYSGRTLDAANTWQLVTVKITMPEDAPHEYVAINTHFYNTNSAIITGFICRPMLEEGDEYNGWTLSEQDYDYVGGNLLDNTATLAKSGNLATVGGTVTQNGMGESASIRESLGVAETYSDFLQFSTSGMGLKAGEDYVLSFYAKADSATTAGKLQCYLYPSSGTTNTEDSAGGNDNSRNPSDGSLLYGIVPTTTWRRYWVHWRPSANDQQYVLFRLFPRGTVQGTYSSTTSYAVDDVVKYNSVYWRCVKASKGNAPSSSSSYWEATIYNISIAQPKLEVGATMTEWTEKRADMVDKQALLATGIDIENKKITLTANNTTFQDNNGNELAVIDQEGLHASKISTTDTGSGHTVMSGNTTIWYQKDGVTPGIQVFYDAAGVPHFQFCGADGKVKYDFGPSGLQSFINDTQSAYSDTAYLHKVTSVSEVNGKLKGLDWCYVVKNASADECYIYRKQIPTTDTSSAYNIYDGCVFKGHKYSGTDWPSSAYLLPDGWYVEPNGGYLPSKLESADDEAVYDPTKTVYYQTFCYYSSGKMTRRVRAYMTILNESIPASKYLWNDTYDEL